MTAQTEGQAFKKQILTRVLVIIGVGLVWAICILTRLTWMQGLASDDYRERARAQQDGYRDLVAKRGDILDRHLQNLAATVRADSIFCRPKEVEQPQRAAELLSPLLEVPVPELASRLSSKTSFVYLKRKVPPQVAQQIRDLDLPGIHSHEEPRRVYPARKLASHLIGFVGVDDTGLGGLEYLYDDLLKGKPGRMYLKFDGTRKSYLSEGVSTETEGDMLVLTLDSTLQYIAESVLQRTVDQFQALNGSVVLMNPHNGEILALASYPDFNPNDYPAYSPEQRRNRAILDTYEPGSTFKIITLTAALNEGVVAPTDVIDCSAGSARLGRKVYKEAKHTFGELTVQEIIAKSSNIGTVQIAIELGAEKLYDYVSRFEFGQKTGVELPGEEAGLLRPLRNWSKISVGAISIGQEIGVTPLQLVRAVSTIANGGYLVKPRLVQRVLSPAGDVVSESAPEGRRIIERETAETVKSILTTVVTEGTGRNAALKGYSSAGKTGTAQKIVDGRYSHSKYVASFVGFAPVSRPALVGLVVINEPHGIPYGGFVAGPAFKEIMERALLHLGVPQDQPAEIPHLEQAALRPDPRTIPRSKRGPAPQIEVAALEETQSMEGLAETMDRLLGGSTSPAGSRTANLIVTSDSRVLPDFSGMNLRQVVQECTRLDIRLKLSGSGVAVGQRPEAGTRVLRDMVCEVFFSTEGKGKHAPEGVALGNDVGLVTRD